MGQENLTLQLPMNPVPLLGVKKTLGLWPKCWQKAHIFKISVGDTHYRVAMKAAEARLTLLAILGEDV